MAIREASPLGHHSTLPAGGRVPERTRYPAGARPYIIALGLGSVLQGSGKMSVHRLRRIHSPRFTELRV